MADLRQLLLGDRISSDALYLNSVGAATPLVIADLVFEHPLPIIVDASIISISCTAIKPAMTGLIHITATIAVGTLTGHKPPWSGTRTVSCNNGIISVQLVKLAWTGQVQKSSSVAVGITSGVTGAVQLGPKIVTAHLTSKIVTTITTTVSGTLHVAATVSTKAVVLSAPLVGLAALVVQATTRDRTVAGITAGIQMVVQAHSHVGTIVETGVQAITSGTATATGDVATTAIITNSATSYATLTSATPPAIIMLVGTMPAVTLIVLLASPFLGVVMQAVNSAIAVGPVVVPVAVAIVPIGGVLPAVVCASSVAAANPIVTVVFTSAGIPTLGTVVVATPPIMIPGVAVSANYSGIHAANGGLAICEVVMLVAAPSLTMVSDPAGTTVVATTAVVGATGSHTLLACLPTAINTVVDAVPMTGQLDRSAGAGQLLVTGAIPTIISSVFTNGHVAQLQTVIPPSLVITPLWLTAKIATVVVSKRGMWSVTTGQSSVGAFGSVFASVWGSL